MTTTEKPTLNQDLLVEVRGKKVPSYAGVLDLAHQWGLTHIETTLLQVPNEANGNVAIVKATVHLTDASGVVARFDGLGDAAPNNVNSKIVPHLIRMAETRAKGRALRDATNIGLAIAEELGEDHAEPTMPSKPRPPTPAPPPPARPHHETMTQVLGKDGAPKATEKQVKAIRAIADKLALDPHAAAGRVLNRPVPHLSDLPSAEASKVIKALDAELHGASEVGR